MPIAVLSSEGCKFFFQRSLSEKKKTSLVARLSTVYNSFNLQIRIQKKRVPLDKFVEALLS